MFLIGGIIPSFIYIEMVRECEKSIHYTNQLFINIFKTVGILATFWAANQTYKQLRKHYSRINSYGEFYEHAEMLINEIYEGKGRHFYFYGPTIVPGNVACEDRDLVEQYKNNLEKIYKLGDIRRFAIVPTQECYDYTYKSLKRHPLSNVKGYNSDLDLWERYVDEKRDEAIKFQGLLRDYIQDDSSGRIYGVDESKIDDIKKAYFISNGNRIIYAVPLHYSTFNAGGKEMRTPHLVGFTSTDKRDINAFNVQFDEIREELRQEWLLHFMYSRHSVNPENLYRFMVENNLTPQNKPVDELAIFDHDHFGNKKATDICIELIGINNESQILDIGSGLGGPARYIANRFSCTVTGIELQKERWACADLLSRQMGFSEDKLKFERDDACNILFKENYENKYTHIIAFLSILHMIRKEEMLVRIGSLLTPNGMVFIEDFCEGENPAPKQILQEAISCPGLLSMEKYIQALKRGGIEIDEDKNIVDMTEEWTNMARQRVDYYSKAKDNAGNRDHIMMGYKTISQALCLYESVYNLFKDGAIRGIRVVGKKTEGTNHGGVA